MRLALLLLIAAPLFAQADCTYNLQGRPRGSVLVYRNGIFQPQNTYVQSGSALQTIVPLQWADHDQMSYVYFYAIQSPAVPGTSPPFKFNIYIPTTEYHTCSGWSPPIFFSLDSTTANPGDVVTLHLSFTNAIIPTAALQFTLTYDPAAVVAISATAGPSAVNAGKNISCAGGSAGNPLTCVIDGINLNNMQDGVAAIISVSTISTATLPTTIGISKLSGTLMGVNLLATVAIPGQAGPANSGVISRPVAVIDTTDATKRILQAVSSCDGTNAAGCAAGFAAVCAMTDIPPNCKVECPSGSISCSCPIIQSADGSWYNRCSLTVANH